MGQLKLVSLNDKEEFLLSKPEMLIGRAEQNDIVITKDLLSRKHAKLVLRGDEWSIEDLGSTNGTFVNNRQVQRPTAVKAGDVIKLGREVYYLSDPDDPEQTIMSSRLPQSMLSGGGSVVIDDGDSELTSFQQSYHLPPGWEDSDDDQPAYSSEAVERLLKNMANAKPVPDVALLFFIRDQRPLVFGVSKTKTGGTWTIGRAKTCKIRIDDPSISTHHATLHYEGGSWRLSDEESTNGLRIHGELRDNISLSDGAAVAIGRAELVFRHVT